METYNGVFVSDVVGLGKTYICAMLAKSLKKGRKLVICPPVLMNYTLALLQTSEKQIGNHPEVLIFDEPTQHSIGAEDANAFFKRIIALGDKCQVIVGITVNNADIKNVISN